MSKILVILLICLCGLRFAEAQSSKKTRILFILDCSNSMDGVMDGKPKMQTAKKVLIKMVDSLNSLPDIQLALRPYGNTSPTQDCKDTRLEVAFEPGNVEKIKTCIQGLKSNGATPIAYSLTQAASDFPDNKGRNIIILITDGEESCQGDPCKASKALQDANVILKPFIIGIGLTEDVLKSYNCVGRYYNTKSENDFKKVLNLVVSQALNSTTMQVNLMNSSGLPTETNVNLTFFKQGSPEVAFNIYHTLSKSGAPDSFPIDPSAKYDLQINSLPPVYKNNIEVKAGKHNVINVNLPQGSLQLAVKKGETSRNIRCVVKQKGRPETVYVQDFNSTSRYISGAYNLEILTLPRIVMNDVDLKPGQINKIEIPQPGRLELGLEKEMTGSIFQDEKGKTDWVADLSIPAAGLKSYLNLQPGTYKIHYRLKSSGNTRDTKETPLIITPGNTSSIILK